MDFKKAFIRSKPNCFPWVHLITPPVKMKFLLLKLRVKLSSLIFLWGKISYSNQKTKTDLFKRKQELANMN